MKSVYVATKKCQLIGIYDEASDAFANADRVTKMELNKTYNGFVVGKEKVFLAFIHKKIGEGETTLQFGGYFDNRELVENFCEKWNRLHRNKNQHMDYINVTNEVNETDQFYF